MGKRYVQHSDLCGCERCAVQADREDGKEPIYITAGHLFDARAAISAATPKEG